jgi:hypothetical protein
MRFARLLNGLALEPEENKTSSEYVARYDAAVIATWGPSPVIAQVCENVQHDAQYLGGDPMDPAQFVNPDGTDGNGVPIPPSPVVQAPIS